MGKNEAADPKPERSPSQNDCKGWGAPWWPRAGCSQPRAVQPSPAATDM